jgi:hypothetical protein
MKIESTGSTGTKTLTANPAGRMEITGPEHRKARALYKIRLARDYRGWCKALPPRAATTARPCFLREQISRQIARNAPLRCIVASNVRILSRRRGFNA